MIDMELFPQIPGYRIEKKLGDSTIANVFLAIQEDLDRQVSIKVLNPGLFKVKEVLERFLKEARKAAQFVHPNIVNILEVGESENLQYIVMEYLPASLRNIINYHFNHDTQNPDTTVKKIKLDGPDVLNILKQLAWAIDYAHKEGVVHRNIRPENIRFREDGTPVIVDFFISRVLGSEQSLKEQGVVFGSPHYGSPERALGKRLEPYSDIYSLGVVLFEMLTGNVPYDAEEAIAIENQHIMEPVPLLPSHLNPFQPLINRMMAKTKEERIASGAELVQLINQINPHLASDFSRPTRLSSPAPIEKFPPFDPLTEPNNKKEEKLSKKDKHKKTQEQPINFADEDILGNPLAELAKPTTKKPRLNLSFNPKILIPIIAGIVIIAAVWFFMSGSSNDQEDFSYGPPKPTQHQSTQKTEPSPEESQPLTEEQKKELETKKQQSLYQLQLAQRAFNAGQYQEADKKLKEARAILDSPEAQQLANQISTKLSEAEEDSLYQKAIKTNTIEALQAYLNKFPSGRYSTPVDIALNKLKEEIRQKEEIKKQLLAKRSILRSLPQLLTVPQAKEMINKWNFFDHYYNPKGNFKNDYELRVINQEKVVVDNATGLMWQQEGSPDHLFLQDGKTWLKDLNKKTYAGFSDWRLPTLEEALSVLEPEDERSALFINPVFSKEQKYIWTCDTFETDKAWALDYFSGDVNTVPLDFKAYVRPVRTFVNDK